MFAVFLSWYLWEGELSNSHHISIFSRSTHAPNALESFQLRDRTNQFDSIDSVACYWWQLIDKQDQKKSNNTVDMLTLELSSCFLGIPRDPVSDSTKFWLAAKVLYFVLYCILKIVWLTDTGNNETATLWTLICHMLPSTGNLIDYSTKHYFWIFNNPNLTGSLWVCLGIPTQKNILYIEEKISTCAEAISLHNNLSCTRSVLNIWVM